ncbi:MAG: glycerol-3-phosphate dehydrogenase/oxidase [Limisphaerales bacterium]
MKREAALDELDGLFDVLVIGGGSSGLGAAWDAASRGYRTVLIEQHDFAQGTSSRSTKLIHGGVRYLAQLNISLVRESLSERKRLLENAPDLVQWREFVIPTSGWAGKAYYGTGLKVYDALAGSAGKSSHWLDHSEVLDRLPGLRPDQVSGGVSYWDGQFDDAQLAFALVAQVFENGGLAINHARFDSFLVANDRIQGARFTDTLARREYEVRAKVVINATGVMSDSVRQADEPKAPSLIAASRGSHIVLPVNRLGEKSALMIPKTEDGRVLFAIPWRQHLLVGTTDFATDDISSEPSATDEEIDFLLDHLNERLRRHSSRDDILSTFAGLRPLVRQPKAASTSSLSRDHFIEVSAKGLVSVVGGKWTTFRKMGEEVVDRARAAAGLPDRACRTAELKIPSPFPTPSDQPLDERLPLTLAEVERAMTDQMAVKLEDVLARRSRCLFVDARASMGIAPEVARIMAKVQGHDDSWVTREVESFEGLARSYLPDAPGGD